MKKSIYFIPLTNRNLPYKNYYSYECVGGIMKDESIKLLRDFYEKGNPLAPPEKRQRKLVEDIK